MPMGGPSTRCALLMSAQQFEHWRAADRLIRAAGVPYDMDTRRAQHQLVRLVAETCAELGSAEAIRLAFGEPQEDRYGETA